MRTPAKFIVFDGPDGGGKSSQIARAEAWLTERGMRVCRARDPGGTPIGDRIRHILLGYDLSAMHPRCEALLFMASRAQLVAEVIAPALERGQTVLCDRFISATCAYQGAVGVPAEDIIQLGRLAVGAAWPDLTLILDVPPDIGFQRTGRKPHHAGSRADAGQLTMFDGAAADAMERRPIEFHRRVQALFKQLPGAYPGEVKVIDASRSADEVWLDVAEALTHALH